MKDDGREMNGWCLCNSTSVMHHWITIPIGTMLVDIGMADECQQRPSQSTQVEQYQSKTAWLMICQQWPSKSTQSGPQSTVASWTAKRRVSYDSLLWLKTGGFKKKDIRMDFVEVLYSFPSRRDAYHYDDEDAKQPYFIVPWCSYTSSCCCRDDRGGLWFSIIAVIVVAIIIVFFIRLNFLVGEVRGPSLRYL